MVRKKNTTASQGVCAASNRHKNLLLSQLARSLCTAGQTCLHNLSLSFAGPREYRWQGLEVPVMMGKRRGTAHIATASLKVCAASNRHKNLLFSQLDRSLCLAAVMCVLKSCLSFAGPREYRWQGLEVPAMMGKRRGAAQIATAPLRFCATSNRHKKLLFSTRSLAVYTRSNMPP